MTLLEFQERSRDIVDAGVDGKYHESTLDLISDVLKDYEQRDNTPDNGWQEKYERLKEKYIERFYGGTVEDSDILEEPEEESDTETITTEEVVKRLMED